MNRETFCICVHAYFPYIKLERCAYSLYGWLGTFSSGDPFPCYLSYNDETGKYRVDIYNIEDGIYEDNDEEQLLKVLKLIKKERDRRGLHDK